MAIGVALVGRNRSTGSSVATPAGLCAAGDTLVAIISFDPGTTITSLNDLAGNGYGSPVFALNAGGARARLSAYVVQNAAGHAANILTVNFSGAAFPVVHLIRVTGAAAVSHDTGAMATTTADNLSPYQVTSGALAQAASLLLCCGEINQTGAAGAYSTSDFTLLSAEDDASSYWTSMVGYSIVAATTPVTASMLKSGAVADNCSLGILAFMESTAIAPVRGRDVIRNFGPGRSFAPRWLSQALPAGGSIYDVAVVEAGTAATAFAALLTAAAANTEAVTAAVTKAAALTIPVGRTESGTADAVASALQTLLAATTETGTAAAVQAAFLDAVAALVEAVTAAMAASTETAVVSSVTETGSAAAAVSAILSALGALTEAGAATALESAIWSGIGAVTESGAPVVTVEINSAQQSNIVEAASAVAAVVSEMLQLSDLTEIGNASDSLVTQLAVLADLIEAGATDAALIAQLAAVAAIAEIGNVDVVFQGYDPSTPETVVRVTFRASTRAIAYQTDSSGRMTFRPRMN